MSRVLYVNRLVNFEDFIAATDEDLLDDAYREIDTGTQNWRDKQRLVDVYEYLHAKKYLTDMVITHNDDNDDNDD